MFLLLLKLICNFRTGEMDLDEFGPSGFGECPGEQVVFLILKRIHVFLGSAGGRETVNAWVLLE
jgi:hypothetical protein